MADTTKIEWTDATWNPITGCSVVSPGCTNCYAMRLAGTRMKHHHSRAGLTQDSKAGPVWNGQVRLNESWLDDPLRWKRPRRIFVCAHGDLFHESVPNEWIDRVFAVMAGAPQHIFQVLTKRPERMQVYVADREDREIGRAMDRQLSGPIPIPVLPNVWLGVSVEDQARADERIPVLLGTPAAVRFVSAEPLLGPVDLTDIPWPASRPRFPDVDDVSDARSALRLIEGTRIDWLIVGGESGPGARPMHPDWARALRDQCQSAGVAYHFKQWGEWAPADGWYADHPVSLPLRVWRDGEWTDDGGAEGDWLARIGKRAAGRSLDGRTWDEMPEAAP